MALAPEIAMLVMVKVALPVLLRVTVRATLVMPTAWLPKERLVEERLADTVARATEIPAQQGTERMRRALMSARGITALTLAGRGALARKQDASTLCPLQILGEKSVGKLG